MNKPAGLALRLRHVAEMVVMITDGRCILVVEDEPLIRFALCDMLLESGFQVLEAKDALAAIAVFGMATRIDAVISDVDMPGHLNGLDFVRLVASSALNIPIILTTGRERHECGDLPEAVHYLAKPYDETELLSLLSNRLERSDIDLCSAARA